MATISAINASVQIEQTGLTKFQAVARGRYERRLNARKNMQKRQEQLEAGGDQPSTPNPHEMVEKELALKVMVQTGEESKSENKVESKKMRDRRSTLGRGSAWQRGVFASQVHPEPDSPESIDSTEQRLRAIDTIVPGFSKRNRCELERHDPKSPTAVDVKNALGLIELAERRIEAKTQKLKPSELMDIQVVVEGYRERTRLSSYLIMPESTAMQHWDLVAMCALLFTATVTPYEVALLDVPVTSPLFALNRAVDLIFLIDLVLCCFTATRKRVESKLIWITDLKQIRSKYFRGWFVLDFISLIPFDVLTLLASGGAKKVLQQLRILRLLKLVRIVKVLRFYRRWESRISWPYAYVALANFSVLLITCGHWMACCWALIGVGASGDETTWVDFLENNYLSEDGRADAANSKQIYVAALYWSITTITSVGYGDITPRNTLEMFFCTFLIMFGSIVWAYIIGNACGIVNTIDVATLQHRHTMDQLNRFMEDQGLPQSQRLRLRAYFNNCRDIAKSEGHRQLIAKMSPTLKEEVALSASKWLSQLEYFKGVNTKFLVTLSNEVISHVYVPGEVIEWSNALFSVARGVAARHGLVMLAGGYWGSDFILETHELKDTMTTRALTYVDILVLDREILFEMLEDFPEIKQRVRRSQVRMAVSRGILRVARVIATAQLDMDQVLSLVSDSKDEAASARTRSLLFSKTNESRNNRLRRSSSIGSPSYSAQNKPRRFTSTEFNQQNPMKLMNMVKKAVELTKLRDGPSAKVYDEQMEAVQKRLQATADRLDRLDAVFDVVTRLEAKIDGLVQGGVVGGVVGGGGEGGGDAGQR